MVEKDSGKDRHTIYSAATLLWAASSQLGVEGVTWESRRIVQTAFRMLLKREDFRLSIEKSRPDVDECHLIFSPHAPSAEDSLVWWICPYEDLTYPDNGWRLFSYPFFSIDPGSGGIPTYWDEEGDFNLCGYDEFEQREQSIQLIPQD